MGRRWRRRPRTRRMGMGRALALSALIGLGLGLVCVSWLNSRMTPMLLALAEARVSNDVTGAVTRRVEATLAREDVDYADMVRVEKDAGGRVTALSADTARMNALRAQVVSGVLEDVEGLAQESIAIPVGNLTGIDLLSDLGPSVQVGLVAAGVASGEFKNDFSAAGVNQTRHVISLEVSVTLSILLPSGPVERVVTTAVPVAETIIVGEVPQQYVTIGTGDA